MSQDVQGMLIQIEATTAQLRRELASADQVVARTTQQIDRNLATVDTAFDRTAAGAQQAGQLIRGAFAAMAGAGLVGALIQQADAVGQMDDRMRAATGGSMEYEMVQRRLLQTAQETYRPLREAQELYIRTADAVRAMGYDTQQTLDITDSFSYLLVTNAASADKASGALDAYSKALQTGKVEADGWTTIVSAMPTVVDAIATATGQSAAEVRRLGASGKLALDDINRGLLETLERNRQAAADMSVSVADALNNIGNAVQVYIGQLNQSSGATDGLAEALGVVAENIDVVAAVVGGVAAGALGVYTRAAVVAAAETVKGVQAAVADRAARIAQADAVLQAAIADQRKAQTAVILAQREAEAARGTAIQTQMSIQLAQARQREAAATAAVTAAQTGLRQASTGLLGLLGGPMGIAMLAGSAAAAFLLLRDNTDEVAGSLGDLKTPLEQVRAEFERLGDAEQRLQLTRLSQQIEQEKTKAASALDELREAFANSLYGGSGNRAPSPEAEAALGRLGKAMAAASQGQPVNWLAVAESMRGVQGVSTTLVEKTLAVAAGQEASARTTAELQARHDALTASLGEGTRAQRENAAASAEAVEAGDKYIAQLEKRLGALQDKTALQAANRFIAENTGLTAEQVAKIRELAAAQDAQRAAEARATESAKAGKKATEEKLQALAALVAKYDPAAKAQADYEQGIRLADEALLKGAYTTEQYQAVVQGLWVELNKPGWEKFNKGATETEARLKRLDEQVRAVSDRLDPAAASARKLADEKKLLREAVDAGALSLDEFRLRMRQLDDEYAQNQRATSAWAQWTDSALERVDSAFADAWRNIGDGFDGFRDSLTNAFKQLLAELAHLAITRPIVMQIGAALGIGGGAGQVSSMLGSSGSGSAGGLGFGDISNAFSLYQASQGQGFLGSVWSGYQSGGLSGAWSGATGYGSGLLSGIDASAGQLYGTLTNGASATYAPLSYQAQVGGWGEITQGAAPWLSGLSGAYMGYKQAGVKGAVAGGLGGWGGAKAGAAMGSYFGPIGTAVGAVLGGILGSIGGASIFGGDWQTKNYGLAFSVNGGDFLGQSYEDQKKKGGLFGSDKKRTKYHNLDPETAAKLQETFDATQAGVSDLLARIGISVSDGAYDGLRLARRKISTKGKTDQEIQAAVAEWFGYAADSMIGAIDAGLGGFGYSFEELTRRVAVFESVNDALELIDVRALELSAHSMELANGMAEVAGGLEAFSTGIATYYGAFFSAAEQQEKSLHALLEVFAEAELAIPGSRAAYREMVEAIDVTTDAGREMFATLMRLAGQADSYYDTIEAQLMGAVSGSMAALQRSIAAEQKRMQEAYNARLASLNDMAGTARDNLSGLTAVANGLDAALKRLRGSSTDAVRALREQALATLQGALATVRAGGSLADVAGLQDALDVAAVVDPEVYQSLEDFQREQGRTANLVAELQHLNGKQLTAEERLLERVQAQIDQAQAQYDAQMAGLDAQLEAAQAQLDALNGIDDSVQAVATAIAAMNAAVVAALQGMPKGAAQANTPANNRSLVDSIYQAVLGRSTEGDEAGAAFWAQALQSGAATYQDVAASIARGALGNSAESAATHQSAEAYLKSLGLPGFATGGSSQGGAFIAGEIGPELVVTGPARIHNARQTAAALRGDSNAELVSELRALRQEVARQGGELRSIANNTDDSRRALRQQNEFGVLTRSD